MRQRLVRAVVVASMGAIACAASQPPPDRAQGLAGTSWRLTHIGVRQVTAIEARTPTLLLETGGRVAGSDGCNRISGSYTVDGSAVTFSKLAGTLMACADGDEYAAPFRGALESTARWRLTGDGLELLDQRGTLLARFTARAAPASR